MNSLHKRGFTLLAVGFTVMVIYPPFAPSEVDPFVGCVDGENVPHVIIRDFVSVFYLHIGQNICTSMIFFRVPAVLQWAAPPIE